jgi:hypothetical protein
MVRAVAAGVNAPGYNYSRSSIKKPSGNDAAFIDAHPSAILLQ